MEKNIINKKNPRAIYLPGELLGCLATCIGSKRSPETAADKANNTYKQLTTTILYTMIIRKHLITEVKVNQCYVLYTKDSNTLKK